MQQVAILGYGKEGQAVHDFFRDKPATVTIFDKFALADLSSFHLEQFDLVFRSPSVPLPAIPGVQKTPDDSALAGYHYELPNNLTSSTKYFFAHCPCQIIGVTGTKGKGTTCSMLAAILRAARRQVHLLGNIGTPAIAELGQIQKDDIVVYEMSSFQLWDLTESPSIAVVLRVEPDHLDVHPDFTNYLAAKSHITAYQHPEDTLVYFKDNANTREIVKISPAGHQIPYPAPEDAELKSLLDCLQIPGQHNRENAQAAILAAQSVCENITAAAKKALAEFRPLPHHLELIRTLSGVDYYDDSFSASYPSMDVAIAALENTPIILIAGGKNRHLDLKNAQKRIFSAPSVKKVVLMGETAPLLAEGQNSAKYELVKSLKEAVEKAQQYAEAAAAESGHAAVLLSPGAASFDMFKNFADRGDQFQALVKELQ